VKLTPWSASRVWTFLITVVPSERSSSLRISTTLSRLSTACLAAAAGLAAEAVTIPKASSIAAATQIHLRPTTGRRVSALAEACVSLGRNLRKIETGLSDRG
jgi:hypothetical protein